ncbi:hypothetical protein K435DRAFT_117525 [Dendrothele bispora CBS 962.96]|uniref:Required for respiratory growth protein 9, mitochondrial n=1 Tax=Dendrothele bispora (strain CBS 962.96) TaxID=1314807 RepID=A0A4S8MQA3_DENBC|nr:hypothetical protein K435DRAFT_117525 [Dendrothele bispora CBS 962.96]
MLGRRLQNPFPSFTRSYAQKWPRPKRGTSERPPMRHPDPLINSDNTVVTALPEENLTFIHRPPPTAPSPLSYITNPVSPLLRPATVLTEASLPPLVRPEKAQPQRASDKVVAEIRRLRALNPTKYTRGVLAQKFGVTQQFVGMIAATKKSTRKSLIRTRDGEHQVNRDKWSDKRSLVVAIRKKRREHW